LIFYEQPLDDTTVNKFFAEMPGMAPVLAAMCDPPIYDLLRADPETVDLARGFYLWTKRERLPSKDRDRNLERVQTAHLTLADALQRLRADRELRIDEGEPPASTPWASSAATTAGPSSTSTLLGPSAATLTTTPNPPLPRLEPEALRLRAKIYDPGRWTPTRRKKGGNTGEAWAFAALVSVLTQQYEREPGQIAKPSGAFLERVRTEISKVEQAHSKGALRKRVARALKKRAAWT